MWQVKIVECPQHLSLSTHEICFLVIPMLVELLSSLHGMRIGVHTSFKAIIVFALHGFSSQIFPLCLWLLILNHFPSVLLEKIIMNYECLCACITMNK